jgi:hypothetical protein
MVVAASQPQMQSNFGGGFIEFLFGDSAQQPQRGTQQWFGAPPQEGTYGISSLHTTERKRPARSLSVRRTRMRHADVIDLYERVKVGTKVVVL